MKTMAKTCLFLCVLAMATQALAWEFNIEGFREGWTRNHSFLDVNDGFLIVTAPANSNDAVRIVSETGPYNSNRISGVYAMVRARRDATALSGAGVQSWTADYDYRDAEGQHGLADEFIGDPSQSELMYADLTALQGQTLYNIGFSFPNNGPEDVDYEVDWIRWEGIYIDNESFEYWDTVADKIANWTSSAAYDFPDDLIPDKVHGRTYAATLTGTGQSETISQDIKGAMDLLKDQKMIIYAALLVPADAAGTEVILNIAEQGKDGNWSTGSPLAVDTLDAYFDVAVETALQLEPADRTGLRVEVSIKSPVGKKVYLDDVFVDTLPEPVEVNPDINYGWPINCVKLGDEQAKPVIDGVVTPEEYAGAQVLVYNRDTAFAADAWDPNWIHDALSMHNPHEWTLTPPEDFNGLYYFMWDANALYVACSIQDDSYVFNGPNPNAADNIQFTLSENPCDSHSPRLYIPTIAPRGTDGQPIGKNNWGFAYQWDLFAEGTTVEYGGAVDDATQDWAVEARYPWEELIGDFNGDLVNGDQDGNGRNVFPPEIGQICGFVLVAIDTDATGGGNQSWTQGGQRPWSNIGQCAAQPMTFIGPAQ
ncbi:hypothetical protein ACFL6U_30080 [Planctomycetota bacterium]